MKKLFRKIRIYFLKVIFKFNNKTSSTHLFFFSKGQREISLDMDGDKRLVYFNGKEYTEMMEFRYRWSNWGDAKLLGVGTYDNIFHARQ